MKYNKKWRCNTCKNLMYDSELLHGKNPFCEDMIVVGCPYCKDIGDFTGICDEPGCSRDVSCGFPSPDGYRTTCHEHSESPS